MDPEQNRSPGANPISIDFNLNSLIQRVDTNVRQQIIITTADKARLCLMQALARIEQRKSWIAPAGILATLAAVFPTTTFNDFLGLPKDYWRAVFTITFVLTVIWLVRALLKIRASLSIDEIVDQLRTESLATGPQETPTPPRSLLIMNASYGHGDKWLDVTNQLNAAIRDGRLQVHVGNELAGDPYPGTPKHLRATYRHGDQEQTKTFAEGEDLNLP